MRGKTSIRIKIIGLAFAILCSAATAQLHFSDNASIDVTKAGVSSTDPLLNWELKNTDIKFLRFNVLWGLHGPVLVNGKPLSNGLTRDVTGGISHIVTLERKILDAVLYEVKLVPLSDQVAAIMIEWTTSDGTSLQTPKQQALICTICKSAPNEVGPIETGKLGAITYSRADTYEEKYLPAPTGTAGRTRTGHWVQVCYHGQYSYVQPAQPGQDLGDFVTVGWIAYGYNWVETEADSRMER